MAFMQRVEHSISSLLNPAKHLTSIDTIQPLLSQSQPVDAATMMQAYTPPPQVELPGDSNIVPPVNKSAVMTDYVTGARPVQQSPKVGESTGEMVPGAVRMPVASKPVTSPKKRKLGIFGARTPPVF